MQSVNRLDNVRCVKYLYTMPPANRHVSDKWLQSYLDEYAWRYNQRYRTRAMFKTLLDKAAS